MNDRLNRHAGHHERTMPNTRYFEIVGATIKAMREAAGVSVVDLARECFISRSALYQIERGRGVAAPTLTLIAHALDVSLNEIVTMEASDALLGAVKSEAAE